MRRRIPLLPVLALVLLAMFIIVFGVVRARAAVSLTPTEELGKAIFFDTNLSINQNQSCASCHGPDVGWTGPISLINDHGAVYEGSIPGRFGDRKPPSAAYATLSPIFYMDKQGLWLGGNFWDGRATGEVLGNPAADQALGPFLNPKEQALPDSACVVYQVCNAASYTVSFADVWGPSACAISWPTDVETACATEEATVTLSGADRATSDASYNLIGLTVAAYEGSSEVNAFTSKFDYAKLGMVKLTKQEKRGFALFKGKGKCSRCHTSNGKEPLFTDFSYDNLGIPANPENPVYAGDPFFVDPGLGGFLMNAGYDEDVYEEEWGKVKVPTLRNVDLRPYPSFVKAFGHNGYFKSLEDIVHFYNTRDILPYCEAVAFPNEGVNCWPAPEYADTVNTDELGDLGLSTADEAAIVAFLRTLSDGYLP